MTPDPEPDRHRPVTRTPDEAAPPRSAEPPQVAGEADLPERALLPPAGPRVVIVGPPGAGKSTVGAALGSLWGVPVRDTDSDVEAGAGRSIREIFVDDGEPTFRALERDAVARALAEHDGVLALGGGAVLDPGTQQALAEYRARGGSVVFLDVSLAHAAPRVGLNQARPLLLGNPRAQWQALMEARRPVYTAVSTLRVSTDGLRPRAVAELIDQHLEPARRASAAPIEGDLT